MIRLVYGLEFVPLGAVVVMVVVLVMCADDQL